MLLEDAIKPVFRLVLQIGARAYLSVYDGVKTPDGCFFYVPKTLSGMDLIHLFMGKYEAEELSIVRAHFKSAACIIELGSNIGVVSRAVFDKKLEPGGKMVCVEPNPDTFPILLNNMTYAGFNDKGQTLSFNQVAVGDPERGAFVLRKNLSSGLSDHINLGANEKIIEVSVSRLSDILDRNCITGRYSLVADIEGAEILLFEQEPEVFDRCDQIMIELHEPKLTGLPQTPDEMITKIENIGFNMKARIGDSCYFSREP